MLAVLPVREKNYCITKHVENFQQFVSFKNSFFVNFFFPTNKFFSFLLFGPHCIVGFCGPITFYCHTNERNFSHFFFAISSVKKNRVDLKKILNKSFQPNIGFIDVTELFVPKTAVYNSIKNVI